MVKTASLPPSVVNLPPVFDKGVESRSAAEVGV